MGIYINKSFFCNSLEPTNLEIPIGKYPLILTFSTKIRRILPELISVLRMTAIRIHAGNSYKYSQCCILVGKNDKIGWLSCSKFYEHKLVNIISENKSNSELEVKSCGK